MQTPWAFLEVPRAREPERQHWKVKPERTQDMIELSTQRKEKKTLLITGESGNERR